MLDVSDALKKIYRMNMLPKGEKSDIQGKITFSSIGVVIGNDRVVKDTFRLTESISNTGDLDFGSCNASVVEFTVADVPEDLNEQTFTVTQTVNGIYTVPLGTFTVESCKRQDDLRFKDIVAYDNMRKFDRDVASWYNELNFPMYLKDFRASLCAFCGVEQVTITLVNDNIMVYKTIEATELSGKEILRAIAEINGTFAHINRYGKLTYIGMESFALYPSETLYPSDDLYPLDVTEIVEKQGENAIAYISSKYEDYAVSAIDGVIVKTEDDASTGVVVGDSTNPYILSDNMLILGKTAGELTKIATNLFSKIGNVTYVPHDTESIGLPYVEVGDTVLNANSADKELFIAKRVLTGLSSVMDSFSADGNPKRENYGGIESTEIRKLKGITTKIIKELDRVGVEITNYETETNTKFMVMDGQITAEVARAQEAEASLQLSINGIRTTVKNLESQTESEIEQLSDRIRLKVSKGEIVSEINQSPESIKISASKLDLQGYVTITDLETGGQTHINGSNIMTGTIDADAITTDFFSTASQGAGWTIEGHPTASDAAYICGNNSKSNNVVLKTGGDVAFACGMTNYYPGASTTGAKVQIYHNGNIKCSAINGSTPITSSNIDNYLADIEARLSALES